MNILNQHDTIKKQGQINVLFAAMVVLLLKFIFPEHHVLSWDVFGYYLYLPAKFIYHDPYLLNQDWLKQIVAEYESTATLYQINQHPDTGNWIIKYSMGMSFLYAPFFFIAHWLAPVFGYKQDGFSAIYGTVIESGMFLFSIVGIHYLQKILYSFFETTIAIVTLLLILFATNYVQLTVQYSLLTHVPLFTLYCILIYYTIQWNNHKLWKSFFMIALSAGLITLIRPNEIICVLIPLLWNINKPQILKENLSWAMNSTAKLALSIIVFSIPILFQMWYWKKGTNHWLYYSYQNPGEGFDFLTPYTRQFLFSFRKGWFVYTPLAVLTLSSLILVFKKNKSIFWAILIPVFLSVYIISSWSCWWYAGGSYSQRAILSIYPLLAISLGYGIQFLFSKFKLLAIISLGFMLVLNLLQAWQFNHDILDHERMTFAAYKKIFFKAHKPDDLENYLLVNRSADENETMVNLANYDEEIILDNAFKTAPAGKENVFCNNSGNTDSSSVFMNETNEFIDGVKQTYIQITDKDHFWIKVGFDVFIPNNFQAESPRIVVHFNHGENGTYKYRDKYLHNNQLKQNEWNHIEYLYLTPEVRSKDDLFKVYLWHPTKANVNIDNFKVSVFTPH